MQTDISFFLVSCFVAVVFYFCKVKLLMIFIQIECPMIRFCKSDDGDE